MRRVIEKAYPTVAQKFGVGLNWADAAKARFAPNDDPAVCSGQGASKYCGLYSLGFWVPDAATVVGLKICPRRAHGTQMPTSAKDLRIQFCQGQVLVGNNEADVGTEWPNDLAVREYDGTDIGADALWGLGPGGANLSPADYRAQGTAGFGLAIAATVALTWGMARLDSVQVWLIYDLPNAWFGNFGRKDTTRFWFGD